MNKDKIKECIIQHGVEHLAYSYKNTNAMIWIHGRTAIKKMKSLADSLLRLRSVEIRQVTMICKEEYFIFETNKKTLRISKI